jgi:hypothetical protein
LELIAAELLKSVGSGMVNALNEMIQQVWIDETLPESWTDSGKNINITTHHLFIDFKAA